MLALQLDESVALIHLQQEEAARASKQRRGFLALSMVAHAIAFPVLGLLQWETTTLRRAPEIVVRRQQVTPLVAPRLQQLTQRDPNRGTVSTEVNLDSLLPRPHVDQPPGARPQPRQMAALPPTGATAGKQPDLMEAPDLPVPVAPLPTAPLAALGTAAPVPVLPGPAPAPTKPQIQFEKPGSVIGSPSGSAPVSMPNTSVSNAMRVASQGRGSGGNQAVADFSNPSSPGGASSRGVQQRGSVELMSDPNGVDFRPYLIQVLASVKRNWFAVMPQSARFGRRSQVQIQFAIRRDGSVPKLVIASGSGADYLDRAAVAGVSASNPFPPLPREFQG
ncbi:MAG: TonB family protein, partial [Bryobacterales bacterium]|nr:TonB family protein [Bryobacterales bacterium]